MAAVAAVVFIPGTVFALMRTSYVLVDLPFPVDCRDYLGPSRGRYGQEFRQLLARDPNDKNKYKDHETLLSFYTEDVMRAAEREVRAVYECSYVRVKWQMANE